MNGKRNEACRTEAVPLRIAKTVLTTTCAALTLTLLAQPAFAQRVRQRDAAVATQSTVSIGGGTEVVGAPRLRARGVCSATAQAQYQACKNEIKDDKYEGIAVCFNDTEDRAGCLDEVDQDFLEAQEECEEQFEARLSLCEDLGEDAYDPSWDPADFDPDFLTMNTYLPIAVGNTWSYEGGDETVDIEVLDKYKDVEGVTCIVVQDVVHEEGDLVEDTFDWFAMGTDGTVHYCGELARDYEYNEDDDPVEPELVEIEGSFKHGRDGAKSGILMEAVPMEGDVYRMEWSVGNAEDAAEVLATDYSYGEDEELDEFVPQVLADYFCDDDCLVTFDFSPLEPDAEELKYYAPGIGLFLEVDLESGDIVYLVDCNVDALCAAIPTP